MSNEKHLNGLRPEEFLFACALDPNLVGPRLSPIPPFTLLTGSQGATGFQIECSCSNLLVNIEINDFIIVNTNCGTESGILESVSSEVIQLKETIDNSGIVNNINICCKTICSIRKVLISKIAFTSDRDGNFEIYIMNVDESNQTRLTINPYIDSEADWSPFMRW
ncbi:exosporium leader peptide-containing protein [Bacillus anthracis]|uniref:exosporium leader peptide-containing protein n=1 Tax=Bacillus anthracis TaxID=1392 RepID=UPI0009C74B5B|nr:exosporium leader peptide-containing protein [Bacillus anthracis]OPD56271.1 hypothetical protein BVG01_24995 [Bacillus anthracis]